MKHFKKIKAIYVHGFQKTGILTSYLKKEKKTAISYHIPLHSSGPIPRKQANNKTPHASDWIVLVQCFRNSQDNKLAEL